MIIKFLNEYAEYLEKLEDTKVEKCVYLYWNMKILKQLNEQEKEAESKNNNLTIQNMESSINSTTSNTDLNTTMATINSNDDDLFEENESAFLFFDDELENSEVMNNDELEFDEI
ncbi:16740_t:CDS:2 [Racocetra fulgida]|uniref:16740_t:CDS:1 n=1 Tax=Racocetra fulgida TaxID=60492 RepID=A0A9N8VH27_9GLOM|nr:16740_t:CDS:2 [Racocetra fulgida]